MPERVLGVDAQDPQDIALQSQQRNTHHRADIQVRDRLAGTELLVGRGIRRKNASLFAEHLVDDRPAQTDGRVLVLTPVPHRAGHQVSRFSSLKRMQPRSACLNTWNSVSRILGKQGRQVDAARQAPADFQHGLQFGLRVGSQDIVLPSRGDVPRDHCLLHVVNVDPPRTQLQGRLGCPPERLHSGRRRVVETRLRVAELHDIVVVQLDPPLQCLAVDQRAISTACVLDSGNLPLGRE